MLQDPTKLQPIPSELIHSEGFASKVLNASLNGFYVYDVNLGKNIFINAQYTRLTGYNLSEIQEMDDAQFVGLFHPEDRERVADHIKTITHHFLHVSEIEYRFKTKDGRWIWCLSRDSVFAHNDDGSVAQFIGTFFDISDRKQTEKALRESQADLNRAQAVGKIGSWRLNVQDNKLTWSDESYRICGVRKDTPLTYEIFLGIVHPDDREYVDRKWRASLQGEPYDIEHRFVVDGQVKWVREQAELEFDSEGALLGAFGTCQDITESKRAEESLARERDLLQSVLNSAGKAHLVYLDCGFNFVRVNQTYAAACGYRPEEMIGKNHFDLYPGEEVETIFRQVRDTGQAVEFHDRPFEFPDQPERGVTYWDWTLIPAKDAAGRVAGLILSLFETTARIHAEEALRASEERLRLAISAAKLGVFEWDVSSDTARWENERMFEIFGRTSEEGTLSRKAFYAGALEPEDREAFDRALTRAMRPGKVFNTVCRIRRRNDDQLRWIAFSGRFDYAPDGQQMRLVSVIEDITERKRSEEALRQLNDTLEQRVSERTEEAQTRSRQLQALAQKLIEAEERERDRIAGMLHDDLQQHLATVKMRLEMLPLAKGERGESDDLLRRCVALLDDAIWKTRKLSYDLSPPGLRIRGLLPSLDGLVNEMRKSYGLDVELSYRNDAEPESHSVAVFFYQSLKELLFNTVKHSGAKTAQIDIRNKDGWVVVQAADPGTGADLDQVYARRGREPGLGLFSIEERAQSLGGWMTIETIPGKGWVTTLAVPKAEAMGEAWPELKRRGAVVHRSGNPAASGRTGSFEGAENVIRIVIADDHLVMREGLASLLEEQKGMKVVGQAGNGEEALALVQDLSPDLVLMDLSMPVMDGVEAAGKIVAAHPDVAVIGLSMHDDPATRESMLEAGAREFISKTDAPQTIVTAVRRCVGARHSGSNP